MSYCAVWFNSGPFKNLPASPFYCAVTPCNVCCLTCLKWLLVTVSQITLIANMLCYIFQWLSVV